MTVLITGGAGFIGSHCVDHFTREGVSVVVLDNLDSQVHRGPGGDEPQHILHHVRDGSVRFVRGDIRNRKDVQCALEGVDTIVHLAAAVGVGQSMYMPNHYVDVNVGGQSVLMDEMVRNPSRWKRFVVASSMSIYGEGQYSCREHGFIAPPPRSDTQLGAGDFEVQCPHCAETLEPMRTGEHKGLQCSSIYAISKKTQEEMALCLGKAYQIPTLALRFFNVYGSRQSLSNPYTGALAIFVSRLRNGKPPLIFEDGMQSRDFIHVSDVANAVWLATVRDGVDSGSYNICTGQAVTVRRLAEMLIRRLKVTMQPEVLGKFRSGDIRHCIGDPSKAEEQLGFRARYSLEEGLDELVKWATGQRPEDLVESSFAELVRRGLIG